MGQSCPAQWAWPNAPIKTEIHRSKRKLFPDYSFKLINSPHKRVWKKVVRMRFRERESPGSSQEWGKSGLRLKSWFLSELAIAAGLGSNGASHPGTLIWPWGPWAASEFCFLGLGIIAEIFLAPQWKNMRWKHHICNLWWRHFLGRIRHWLGDSICNEIHHLSVRKWLRGKIRNGSEQPWANRDSGCKQSA